MLNWLQNAAVWIGKAASQERELSGITALVVAPSALASSPENTSRTSSSSTIDKRKVRQRRDPNETCLSACSRERREGRDAASNDIPMEPRRVQTPPALPNACAQSEGSISPSRTRNVTCATESNTNSRSSITSPNQGPYNILPMASYEVAPRSLARISISSSDHDDATASTSSVPVPASQPVQRSANGSESTPAPHAETTRERTDVVSVPSLGGCASSSLAMASSSSWHLCEW
mmetsp:Transcript_2621/g.6329  ORF Transcript_2621/g.6329 Transcript_2621/m.6329 type:complete len:234 (+) Transcript_2621:121-822(+)|eukprot:CAMPEP_0179862080 /NCGR_PEP_ID=MMETSP0982-20121206/14636_1 /TAXON_ID=483367 /ORGANISM="non described non described, Strain CCMP 2436" /LENGTH=233 /DNA_ID=CAMNT_0021749729 /DNA_START=750 /DNA_END=1451 /DNA_ORIENTATION=+